MKAIFRTAFLLGVVCWSTVFAQGRWLKLAAFPEPAEELLGASANGKLYVFCGLAPGWKPIGMVYEYDPATNSWRSRTALPTPRNHATAGVVNGKVYVIGGRVGGAFVSSGSSNVGVVEEYDPAADLWGAPKARMPSARSAIASGVLGGRIYVTGGEGQDYRSMFTFRALEAYDPATNTWATLPSMPVSRHGLAGAVLGNRLHMVSGDVQSAGTGVHVHTDAHDAYEF